MNLAQEQIEEAVPGDLDDAPRQVRLTLEKINVWSTLKLSFLLAFAMGVASIIVVAMLWFMLDKLLVWATLKDFLSALDPGGTFVKLLDYVRFPRVMAMTTMFAVINVVVMSALFSVGALLYNLTSSLVGGLKVTLTDE